MNFKLGSFIKFFSPYKKTISLVLIVAAIAIILSFAVSMWLGKLVNLNLPSIGSITTLGVEAYWDANLTDKIDEGEKVDWGTILVGSTNNVTIYLRSVSNIPTHLGIEITNLTFSSANETVLYPPQNISSYMHLTWNYNGDLVNPNDVIPVNLTLRAEYSSDFINYLSSNNIRSFSLNIIINTSEYENNLYPTR
ncbi:MAG: hypothetical protein JSV51_02950 [Candidatus Bathyarchaeota archaeon]|nr:MAG: hypothetical protein JSV51_02950 [Candidatus Bathyarchaeota archaeon]